MKRSAMLQIEDTEIEVVYEVNDGEVARAWVKTGSCLFYARWIIETEPLLKCLEDDHANKQLEENINEG
jgi:hypothetical protein